MTLTFVESVTLAEFPNFSDGDVAVALTATRVYRLHSSVLKRNSKKFAENFATQAQSSISRQERKVPLLIALSMYLIRRTITNLALGFARPHQDINERGRFETFSSVLPELSNGKLIKPIYQCWEWLFGTFYNKQPSFDDETLASLLSCCLRLIDVAESIGSADHVRKIVDLALQQDDSLWSSISMNPGAWAELACRMHSQPIFEEAICHIVGKWSMLTGEDKADLSDDIHFLCATKFKELDIAKEAIEMRILGHYPNFLYRRAEDKPGSPSYAKDIYMWMALDFFRQWFAQNISNGNNRLCQDGGHLFYNKIATGGSAYLGHEDFRNFHQYFPMSSKACAVLKRNMGVLKDDVKPFVQDLMKSQVHLDLAKNQQVKWLTCTVVNEDDCPWVRKEKALHAEVQASQRDREEQIFFGEALLPDPSSRERSSSLVEGDSGLTKELNGAGAEGGDHASDADAEEK